MYRGDPAKVRSYAMRGHIYRADQNAVYRTQNDPDACDPVVNTSQMTQETEIPNMHIDIWTMASIDPINEYIQNMTKV